MNQATVEFRHVSKQYARQGAVVDLSLLVPAGDICVLVGPSGCGKTTTLKMVNRLVEPTSGEILIDGVDVMSIDVSTLRRRIGYVIQQIGLFPHQTIADNVATVPRLLGWPHQRDKHIDIQARRPLLFGLQLRTLFALTRGDSAGQVENLQAV